MTKKGLDINNESEYIPSFETTTEIRNALEKLDIKFVEDITNIRNSLESMSFSFEHPKNIEIADKVKLSFIKIFDDNLLADEESYTKYLIENTEEIMEQINNIQYYASDQWAEWNNARIELITLLNMGTTPLFYDEDNELYFY